MAFNRSYDGGKNHYPVDSAIHLSYNRPHNERLTMTKKMADVHFIRMHCCRKTFKKASGRTAFEVQT